MADEYNHMKQQWTFQKSGKSKNGGICYMRFENKQDSSSVMEMRGALPWEEGRWDSR